MSKTRRKVFLVRFLAQDHYEIELMAHTADLAIAKAMEILSQLGRRPFLLDATLSDTTDWQAVEVV